MSVPDSEFSLRAGAQAGYAGYEYQILVTVWLGLDLMFDCCLSDSITVEPASQEDVEVELRVPRDSAETICDVKLPAGRLLVQIKSRNTGPWSSREFAKIISEGEPASEITGRRSRPLELLKQDDHTQFLFITNAAVEESLLPYLVEKPSGPHETEELPPYARSIGGLVNGKRVRVINGLTEEVLSFRVQSILQRRGHVPSTELRTCIGRLTNSVRSRLLGRASRVWERKEIETVLRSCEGLPEATEDISSYVEPICYPEILSNLQQKNAVILVGTPGTGKTLTARKLGLDHQRADSPYTVIDETTGPSNIFACMQRTDRYLFFLNDPWGASQVESGAARWSQELPRLLKQASPDKRFVITSRSDVVRNAAGSSLSAYEPYAVIIGNEAYDIARRIRILEAKITPLPEFKRDFAQRNASRIVGRLKSPLEISEFARLLSAQQAFKSDTLDKLIHNSQMEAISHTVEQQIKGWPYKPFACSAMTWALLRGSRTIKKQWTVAIRQQLANAGDIFELDKFAEHLESGGSFERRADAIEPHPKVIEGIEFVVREHPGESAAAISALLKALGELYSEDNASVWGRVLLSTAKYVRSDSELKTLVQGSIKEVVNGYLRHQISRTEGHAFGELAQDISEWGLLDSPITAAVDALISGNSDEGSFADIWHPPALPATTIDEIRKSELAQKIFHLFVRYILPQTHRHYGRGEFLSLATQLGIDLQADFGAALDFIIETEVLSFNSDVIVHGALYNDEAFLKVTLDRILTLRKNAQSRFDQLYPTVERARQAELDVTACDHVEEEAGECWALSDDLLEEYVKARRSLQGFEFLSGFDSESAVFWAWSRVLMEYDSAPSKEEVTAFVERSKAILGQRWEVIGKHQRRDLADRFIGDLCNDSPDVRRHCLKALGELFPLQELAAKIGAALASCDWPRVLEVYTDIVRLKKLRDKRVEMRDAIAAFLSADESLLLDAIAFMADAETAEDLKNFLPPTNLSEIKLAASKTDGVAKAYLLRILASANVNVVPLVENVITIGTEEVVGGALDALYAQASREAIDQICRALGHPSYRIRRHAMRLLAATEEQNISQLVLSMAADRSAPVREACATIIGDQLWSDGLPLLMKLLSDNRNYERGYETWTKYNVARAAAKALGRYESHPQETIQAICGFLDGGRVSSEDVIVHALLCYTLAQNPQPEITFRLISGLRNPWHIGREGNLRYPIRIASARALAQLFARARDLPLSELDMKQIINSGLASDARVAAPALMACGFRVETTLPLFQAAVVQQQTQLLRIVLYLLSAASVQNRVPDGDLDRILPNSHPILEILKQNPGQEAAPPSPGLLNWIMTLKSSRSVERSILYLLSQHWKIPIEDFPTLPWDDDNLEPKEIPVMTLRSMFGGE